MKGGSERMKGDGNESGGGRGGARVMPLVCCSVIPSLLCIACMPV